MKLTLTTTKTTKLVLVLPVMLLLSGCLETKVSVAPANQQLVNRAVTESNGSVIFPDDNPSIGNGKVVFDKMNCASCHLDTGTEAASNKNVNFMDKNLAYRQTPLEQYIFITYGLPGNHLALNDKLSRKQLWDLVFYLRSLAQPPLSDEEITSLDPVFGSNCAVCHGKRGFGDGPLSRNMDPLPANFHQFNRFYNRSDVLLWDHIANGIAWESMPNFLNKQDRVKDVKFDKEYIRKLVQYVRHFSCASQAVAEAETRPQKDRQSE